MHAAELEYLFCRIDVPILNNQFDASLIVLKRKFCWKYTDIFYKSQNRSNKKRRLPSEKAIKRLLSPELNYGELLLYQTVNETWWQQTEVNEFDFWDEVKKVPHNIS